MTYTPAYYDRELITAIKAIIVLAPALPTNIRLGWK
jgi:hypothetical protein